METPTPETDAAALTINGACEHWFGLDPATPEEGQWVPIETARKLERERDEARRMLSELQRKS